MKHLPRVRPLPHLASRILPLLALGILSIPTSSAAPPDLTADGVIATINRSETYNLGATGLRGWIYVTKNASDTHGSNGTMTGESRQILVTVASAPANAVLAVDDVILGAMAASTGDVPLFSSDARKTFGMALSDAEKTGGGSLRVKRWRAGTTTDVNIPITILGNYTATAPYTCPKSALILANARNKLVADLKANANFLSNYWDGSITALALLSGVQPGDPDYATVQTRLQTHARNLASAGPQEYGQGSLMVWSWAYNTLFLAEYYLATGDANVLPGIQNYTLKLAQSQSIYGTYGHDAACVRSDGSGRRVNIGYGPVNSCGIVANMAMVMGKKALLAGSQTVDPEINAAIQRGSDYFKYYVNKGSIPYGEHEPVTTLGHASNGKDPMCAVFFGLQPGRATETEYFTRMTIASYNGREYGHTGQGFSYLWGALGANMGGALAVAEHLKPVRWHLDLSRRTDGSFAYDGMEQYGGGSTSGGTYLGASSYSGLNPTASYLLTYSLPLQRLYITGKRDTPTANPPALNLDATTVAHAIDAGNFRIDCPTFTTAKLISSLGDYDPIVRHSAAVELGKRSATITTAELTTLRTMLTGTDANARMGAAQALGLLKDSVALPLLAQRLDKTTEPDLWVRAKAASAIRDYTAATASAHRDAMLAAFVNNATDPDNIDWSDPIQNANSYLSFALFGDAIYGGTHIGAYTINAPKNLLYPAIETGLKHPDSMPRSGVSQFCIDRMPLADVQSTLPAFFKAIESECLADRMWHPDARVDGIGTFTKYKISEGIPYALNMLEVAPGFEHGSPNTRIGGLNALATYGDAARWTLPTLKSYLSKWPSDPPGSNEALAYETLVSTIATIENAITAPTLTPGLAVANSQILITTGPIAITLTGSSPRSAVTFTNIIAPAHGTLSGTAPNLTYTPNPGYTGPDFFTFQVVDSLGASYPSTPGSVSLIVGSAGNGLKGEYFDNPDFTNPVLTRIDPKVDFDWGNGSPHASVGADTFSVRWSGVLLVPETGNYRFSSLSSEGMRLYVNGTLVIDNFNDQSTRWTDGTPIYLTKGQMADILIEYYENSGSAVAKLKWAGPSFAGANGTIIPQAYFFDGSTIPNRPSFAFPQDLTTDKNTALPITLTGSGGSLTYTLLTQPANGTLSGTAPNLIYTPNINFTGTDSFSFYVNNGSTNSLPATVTIGVQAGPLTHFTWNGAATGNWSDATKWMTGAPVAAGQANYALNFNSAGVYTSTHNLNSGFQLNQLNIGGNLTLNGTQSLSFVANGGSPPSLNQNGGALATVVSPIHLAALTHFGGSIASAGKLDLTKQITGPGGIIKNSAGRLRIYGADANNFSGGTIVNNGTLALGYYDATNPLGTGPVTLNGGDIEMERITASNPLTVNGGSLTSMNGFGAIWSGPITLNQTLTVRSNYLLSFNGAINGNAGITKIRGGSLTLGVANSYTGTTEIQEGTLICNNSSALGNGPLVITSPGKVNLNFTGTRSIASLTIDGVVKAPGTYGSTASSATNKSDTYFSGTGTVTVLQPTTTTLSLTSGSSPAAFGSSLTFTATVTGSSPTGNVQFFSGNTLLGSSALNGSYQATFTTNQLAIGPQSLTARYVGNASNGTSNSTAITVEITPAAPAAPTGLTASPGAANSSNISLSWTASAGSSGYYVKRSTTNGGPYTILVHVTGTTCQDTTATPGVSYYYVVSALNAAGESAHSNQATALVTYIGVLSDTDPVIVQEGGTKTFQIKLSSAPAANVVVTVARSAGDADITVSSGSSRTFTTINWDTWQTVTLAAANDGDALDSTATITCTPSNSSYLTKAVTAVENDTTTTLTITNNGNGSTTPTGALTVAKGAATGISATPANAEYLFGNWSVTSGSATFGNENAATTTVTLSAPTTIRANFTPKPYTVTYYGTGSTSGSPPVDPDSPHPHGSTVTVLGNPGNLAKTGYSLAGWNTASNGSGTTYAPGATFTMPMSNVSLHPVWNSLPTADAGPDITTNINNTPPAYGWSYAPWTGDADSGISNEYVYTAAHSFGDNNGGSVTVNGVTFTENFNTSGTGWSIDGGKADWNGNDDAAVSGDSEKLAQEFIYGGYPRTVTFTGLSPGVTYEATFFSVAWETGSRNQTFSATGGTSAFINQSVYNNNNGIRISYTYTATASSQQFTITPEAGSLHLYAMSNKDITQNVATVHLDGTVGDFENDPLITTWTQISGPAAAIITNPSAVDTTAIFPEVGTYTLQLTAADASGSASDTVTITVHPPIVYQTLTYNGNGNTGGTAPTDPSSPYPNGSTVTALGAGTLAKTGHTFAGWNTEAGGGGTAYAANATFTITADTTLYAQWTVNNYTVTFDANGGSAANPASKQVTYNSAYGALSATTRTGHSFNGWFTAASSGTQVTAASTVTTASNHTLYAQWLPDTYIVSYHGNGNTGGNVPANQNKLHDINLTLATNSGGLSKTGYSFTGWNTAANGSGTDYPAGSTYSANSPVTLYAQWGLGTDATWLPTTAGPFNWSDTTNWSGGIAAAGSNRSALFIPNITAAQTVNLDAAVTIGNITFTDSTTSSNDLTISGANTLTLARSSGAPVINVTQSGRTLTIASNITGTNGLQKNGAGTLILSGTNNTYSGTTISAGTLQGNKSSTSGPSPFGTSTIQLHAGTLNSFTISENNNAETYTFGNDVNVGGNASIFVSRSGGTGSNKTHAYGNLSISSNTLSLTASAIQHTLSFTGANLTGNAVIDNATNATTNIGAITETGGPRNLTKEGGATLRLTGNNTYTGTTTISGGTLEVQGSIASSSGITNNATLTFNSGSAQAYGNVISGSGALTKTGAGTLTLSGNHTFTGSVTVGGSGTLQLSGINSYTGATNIGGGSSTGPGTLSVNSVSDYGMASAIGAASSGAINFNPNSSNTSTLIYTGTGGSMNRQFSIGLSGDGTVRNGAIKNNGSGALILTASTFNVTITGTTVGRTLTLGGTYTGSANEIQGVIQNNASGGAISLTKSDASIWKLSGANTYTGTTTISAGKLFINGDQTLATGNVSVAANATLGGTGIIGGNTTIAASGRLEFDLSTNAASHNKLEIASGKTLTFSGASTLTITSSGGTAAGDYVLVSAPSGLSVTTLPTLILPNYWTATVSKVGNDLVLHVTAVTPFGQWAVTSGLSGSNAGSTADPDGDGWTNLQEFAFGTLPSASLRGPLEFVPGGEVTQTGSPVLRGYTPPQSQPPYQAVFGRRKNHVTAGLTYTAEFSANLTYWTPNNTGASILTGAGTHDIEVVAVPFPETVPLSEGGTEAPPKFFRIRVAGTP